MPSAKPRSVAFSRVRSVGRNNTCTILLQRSVDSWFYLPRYHEPRYVIAFEIMNGCYYQRFFLSGNWLVQVYPLITGDRL